jgi:hypothetical protein
MGVFPNLRLGMRLSAIAAGVCACVVMAAGLMAQAPAAPPALSQQAKTMLVEPPSPLLPATLGKLKRVADGDVGDGLGKLAAADAPVLKEDGLRRFAQSDYAGGAEHGSLAVYQFGDASGAISAYDYFKKPGMRPEKLGDDSVSDGDELLLHSGVNVVRANFKVGHEAMAALTGELIDHLPKVGGPAAMAPLLPTLLPAKGFDRDSVKYALGPAGYAEMGGVLPAQAVGFDESAEAVTAKSTARSTSKGGGMLTLLLYPTPEIAGDRGRAIAALMNQKGAGTVKLRREGPLLVMTSGAWPAAEAQRLVDGIHLNSEVSFDKPMPVQFHAEVKKTYSLLVSIAIFCGVSLLAMLVLGLFFGGGRALIRVAQGKPAATEPEFLHIDLREAGHKRLGGPEV